MARKAIVTLAIGRDYSERFEQVCRKNWTAYAERHGFDVIVFKEPLDASVRAQRRSPAWQKCLVLSAPEVAGCERVVWVDSDICINPAAPSIVDGVPMELIGAIDEHSYPSRKSRQALLDGIIVAASDDPIYGKRFWEAWREPGAWHALMGLPGGQSHIVQTGVLVLSPLHHRELLERVYREYDDGGVNLNYEMRPLSHEIQARSLQHWIDARFNALVWWLFLQQSSGAPSESEMKRFLHDCYRRNYFLHFAGCGQLMPLLAQSIG